MKRVCYMCGKTLGYKPGVGTTHGLCDDCFTKAMKELEDSKKGGQDEPVQ